jgi:3-dehydroquinate synthase
MRVWVRLRERSYPIIIARSYQALPRHMSTLGLPRDGWVISHRRLLTRYGRQVLEPLARAGVRLETLTVPESETSKSLAVVQRVVTTLARRAAMRVPLIVAFGGGVIGDLAGFVAATFRRGVPYIQLPTTLLAQVDSAIGGKVGVDLAQGKNLLGAFHQPRLVYNNLSLLVSLPMRQRRSGLAEVIKYGVMADPALFRFVEAQLPACLRLSPRAVRFIVERACRIKAAVVSRDERDTRGLRAQLNFGHTLGHALEAASGFARWTHGEAIAIGMCAAARLSCAMGRLSPADAERLTRLIRRAGLPTRAQGVSRQAVLRALRYDKKFLHGRPRWVLPRRIGRVAVVEDVPEALIKRVIAAHLG